MQAAALAGPSALLQDRAGVWCTIEEVGQTCHKLGSVHYNLALQCILQSWSTTAW